MLPVGELVDALLRAMEELSPIAVYLVVGIAAAVENVFPPIPADVIALFGGFLAGRGIANPWLVFLAVWLCNVAGALLVYGIGHLYGARFFSTPLGRILLRPGQLARLDALYQRRGTAVLFVSRFLPMFRAVVPAFAGMSSLGWFHAAMPISLASGIWYGAVVYFGATAGAEWEAIRAALGEAGRGIYLLAIILLAGVAVIWWRTRREEA